MALFSSDLGMRKTGKVDVEDIDIPENLRRGFKNGLGFVVDQLAGAKQSWLWVVILCLEQVDLAVCFLDRRIGSWCGAVFCSGAFFWSSALLCWLVIGAENSSFIWDAVAEGVLVDADSELGGESHQAA